VAGRGGREKVGRVRGGKGAGEGRDPCFWVTSLKLNPRKNPGALNCCMHGVVRFVSAADKPAISFHHMQAQSRDV